MQSTSRKFLYPLMATIALALALAQPRTANAEQHEQRKKIDFVAQVKSSGPADRTSENAMKALDTIQGKLPGDVTMLKPECYAAGCIAVARWPHNHDAPDFSTRVKAEWNGPVALSPVVIEQSGESSRSIVLLIKAETPKFPSIPFRRITHVAGSQCAGYAGSPGQADGFYTNGGPVICTLPSYSKDAEDQTNPPVLLVAAGVTYSNPRRAPFKCHVNLVNWDTYLLLSHTRFSCSAYGGCPTDQPPSTEAGTGLEWSTELENIQGVFGDYYPLQVSIYCDTGGGAIIHGYTFTTLHSGIKN